ncbi:CehA/McbA family metallohydrolase [Candidatus Poribacteria bacterium]|nr:CehA/McbA family metallohydrolase [Candidatus Poribacteria bacterium]
MADTGILKVEIREKGSSAPTPCRVHLTGSDGQSYYAANGVPYQRDNHFTVNGAFEIELPAGDASILIEKGKEYRSIFEHITIVAGGAKNVEYELERWINMAELGWYSGELHIHRDVAQMAHLIQAEDLNVAPDLTVWNEQTAWADKPIPAEKVVAVDAHHRYGILSQEDERGGGAVLLLNLEKPIDLGKASRWYPANWHYCTEARNQHALVDQEKPFWWEAPVNVAMGVIDTLGILNNHLNRASLMDNEAWGRPRDRERYPGYEGFVNNVLELYYHYLNLGLKLPISAGSASGVLRNPVGYNRLYAPLEAFTYENWFRAVKAGNAFATNGPMLFFDVDGVQLGETVRMGAGEVFRKPAQLKALSQKTLDRVEILFNGEVIHEFQAGMNTSEISAEAELSIDQSGWMVARAYEQNNQTPRLAHTNPIYIEIGGPMLPRRGSAQFYADWCRELLDASERDEKRYENQNQRNEVEGVYRQAIAFYERLVQ